MASQAGPDPEAQRVSHEMERKRREAVQAIADRNKKAHEKAKKQRQESDRRKAMHRGPNPR
jgi:hypothetical protein